jgi:hypothetical protein
MASIQGGRGMSRRINVDIDCKNQFLLLKAYFNMARFCEYTEVFETTNGYHIIGYGFPDMTDEEFYEFRRAMGDDEIRVWLDERLHSKPEQVTFCRRVHIEDGKPRYRTRLWTMLWKPWCSKLPARKPNNGKRA